MNHRPSRRRGTTPEQERIFFTALEQALFDDDGVDPVTEDALIEVVKANEAMRRRLTKLLLGDKNMRRHLLRLWDILVDITPVQPLRLS